MDTSRKAQEGIDCIQAITKQQFKEKELVRDGRIVTDKQQKSTYQHEVVANQMLKVINTVPGLSRMTRQVMSMKIVNPGISDMKVALALAIREGDVKKYEDHGKKACALHMRRVSVEESTGKFNADRIIEAEVRNLNRAKNNSNPLLAE